MPQIPLGNFDAPRVSNPVLTGAPDLSGALQAGRAAQQLGETITDTAMRFQQAREGKLQQQAHEDEALKTAQMLNAASDYEIDHRAAAAKLQQDIVDGHVGWRDAPTEFQTETAQIQAPEIPGLSPVQAERYRGATEQVRRAAGLQIDGFIQQAKHADLKAQVVTASDKNEQLAALSGDTERGVRNNQLLRGIWRAAGFDEAQTDKAVTDSNQRIYTNEIKARMLVGDTDTAQLAALQADLTGAKGRYLEALPADTRLAFATQIQARQQQLDAARAHDADKRETIAAAVVKDVVAQSVSLVMPTPDMVQSWAASVAGTSQAGAFREALKSVEEVQNVRRMTGPQQDAWLQAHDAALESGGGTPQDKARLIQVRAAIVNDQKTRTENPTLYLQYMTQRPAATLDLADLQSGDLSSIGTALAARFADVQTLKRQGYAVKLNLLQPPELAAITGVIDALPPDKLNAMFGQIRAAVGTDAIYTAVMRQVAPGAPLKAYAGELAVRPGGQKVSSLILRGEALLNAKDGKDGKDGKIKWAMPSDTKFQEAFFDRVGNAYQGNPDALQGDLAAARAVYAASAAQDGASSDGETFNPDRFANAMRAVTGEIAIVGGVKVTIPWGTHATDFADQVAMPMRAALTAAGLDPDASGVGLMATPAPGRYVLVQGRSVLWNPASKHPSGRPMPVYFDLEPQPPEPKRGPVERVVRHR